MNKLEIGKVEMNTTTEAGNLHRHLEGTLQNGDEGPPEARHHLMRTHLLGITGGEIKQIIPQSSKGKEINGIKGLDLHTPVMKSMATTGAKPDTTDSPTKTDILTGEAITIRGTEMDLTIGTETLITEELQEFNIYGALKAKRLSKQVILSHDDDAKLKFYGCNSNYADPTNLFYGGSDLADYFEKLESFAIQIGHSILRLTSLLTKIP